MKRCFKLENCKYNTWMDHKMGPNICDYERMGPQGTFCTNNQKIQDLYGRAPDRRFNPPTAVI